MNRCVYLQLHKTFGCHRIDCMGYVSSYGLGERSLISTDSQ